MATALRRYRSAAFYVQTGWPRNAFAELDLLKLRVLTDESPPGLEPPGADLDRRVRALPARDWDLPAEINQELNGLLKSAGFDVYFDAACADVIGDPSYRMTIFDAEQPLTEYRFAVARALVARCMQRYRDAQNLGTADLTIGASSRDRIVELVVAALGGKEAGAGEWVKDKAGGLVKAMATRWIKRRRGRLSELSAGFGADIITYQTRPQPIRDFMRKTVAKASETSRANGGDGELALMGHSLGGIAAVDTLLEEPIPAVRHVITIGSQAPLLYELDALSSLPVPRDSLGKTPPASHSLPSHFPPLWLNIYDVRDFLSYRGERVFGNSRVKDVEVNNGQPFPESHSAYWTNEEVWNAITAYLNGGS
jgi:hypothetical protein